MKELILGGARSGKSALAQQQAAASGLEVVFIATASAGDEEMATRIARHRADRPAHWQLVEEPVALADALCRHATAERCLLVDCLTLWLSNLLHDEAVDEARLARERDTLLQILPTLPGHIILVSNEVGLGVIPLGPLTRRFCDEAGRLHQALAAQCDRVTLTVAGLPHRLKDTTTGDRP
jgi:adenosylcobinamide kinase/adenosylcobinamide-phosphate guanylyltransferase